MNDQASSEMAELPQGWFSESGRPLGGPTVVFDLDGVIADALHRQHFLHDPDGSVRDQPDWRGFFLACVDDSVIDAGRAMAECVAQETCVVILTARVFDIAEQTRRWLAEHRIRHDWLILRGPRRSGSSSEFKSQELDALEQRGAAIALAADDDPRNVEMMRGRGIATLYVPSGYYDQRDDVQTEFR